MLRIRSRTDGATSIGSTSVCATSNIPVVAIGGITAENAGAVAGAGAWGVAVIGAVCGAADPEAGAREIFDALATVYGF